MNTRKLVSMNKKLSKRFYIFAMLFVVLPIALALVAVIWYQRLLTPVSVDESKKQFEIKEGQSGSEIAENLKKSHLIRSTLAFRMYAKRNNIASRFAPGVYYLSESMDAKTIGQEILKGEPDVRITFVEGWRIEEYAKLLEDKFGIPQKEFLAKAKEGYMFPDTYLFNKKVLVDDVVGELQQTFDKRVTEDIRKKIRAQKLTLDEGIVLASIVEREAYESVENERQIVASILLKRLRMGMPLETDATVQYALGYDSVQKKWWRLLTREQLRSTRSVYNTYLNTGLPPAPICNPGLASIKAVAEASDTPYVYYIHGKDGTIRFARTLEEHNANQAKYL